MKIQHLIILLIVVISFSCKENVSQPKNVEQQIESKLELKYAKGFEINRFKTHTEIKVKHPIDGSFIQKFYLSDTSKINSVISSIFSSSTTHLAFIEVLGCAQKVKGFINKNYVYNSTYINQFNSEQTADVAQGDLIDLEKTVRLKPDVFFISGLLGKSAQFERVEQIGIPLIEVVEWAEIHPLARVEWIKFFGELLGKQHKADSIFNEIEKNYLSLKNLVLEIDSLSKPLVLTGSSFKGTWSLPGGKNFSSILMTHAGGNYPFYHTSYTSESLPYSIESVASEFLEADVWLRPGASSLNDLLSEDERYKEFKAFKTGSVFEANKRILPSGANDYWETALIRPDLLLKDLIKIFHPEILPEHELYFYQKLD